MERIVFGSQRKSILCRGAWNFTPPSVYVFLQKCSSSLTFDAQPLRDALDLSRWSTLKNMPRDTTWYASSMDCLDLISQTRPGQERLRSVSIEMSYHMIMLFMIGLIPQILKRLRALQSLKFIVKKKAWTWASFDSCTPGKGKANHVFDREFLLLIKSQLGHITTINTTSFGEAENADEGPCPWVAEQLEKRNRAWTPRIARENQFVRTACAMTAMNPVVFRNVSDTEYAWRRIRPLYRNSDGKIPLIPDEPRDVFH